MQGNFYRRSGRLLRIVAIPALIVIVALSVFSFIQMRTAARTKLEDELQRTAVWASGLITRQGIRDIDRSNPSAELSDILSSLEGAQAETGINIGLYVHEGELLHRVHTPWSEAAEHTLYKTEQVGHALSGLPIMESRFIYEDSKPLLRTYVPVVVDGQIPALIITSASASALVLQQVAVLTLMILIIACLAYLLAMGTRKLTLYMDEVDTYATSLKVSEERFNLAVEGSETAIFDWDKENATYFSSPRLLAMLGYADEMPFLFDLIDTADISKHLAYMEELAASHAETFTEELRFLGNDKRWRWLALAGRVLRSPTGEMLRIILTVLDNTEKHAYEERIFQLAYTDTLTGLSNRTRFLEQLELLLKGDEKGPGTLAILCVNIDHFARYNDAWGTRAGDQLLRETAECLTNSLPPGSLIARAEADTYYIALSGITNEKAVHTLAVSLKREYANLDFQKGSDLDVTLSISASLCPEHGTDANTLLRNTDMAMKICKNMGRNGIRVYEKKMLTSVRLGKRLEQDLPGALEGEELEVVYQPLVSAGYRRIERLLALPRWWHPRLGLLQAHEFLPIARSLGLSSAIENWMVQAVCTEIRRLITLGGRTPRITLVLSAAWLSPQVAASLWREIHEHPFPLDRLEVLIVGYEESQLDASVIDAMRGMGITVLLPNPEQRTRATLLTATGFSHMDSYIVDGIPTEMTLNQAWEVSTASLVQDPRMCLVCQPISGTALREALSAATQTPMRKVEGNP